MKTCILLAFGLAGVAWTRPEAEELRRRLASHASLFKHYEFGRKPLPSMTPDTKGNVTYTADILYDYAAMPAPLLGQPASEQEQAVGELRSWIRHFPVVVLARALDRRSAFTPNRAFIYSDWDFEIVKVFKNVSSEPTQIGDVITVTRPGGTLVQNGVTYSAEEKNFPDFVQGDIYVLLLQPLADGSHSFQASAGNAFLISGSGITRLDDYRNPSVLPKYLRSISADQFLTGVEQDAR